MKLVLLIGPPAVGKMTVGKALEEITDLKLFYNHMSIKLVNKFFDFGTEAFERLDKEIRFNVFREVPQSTMKGLIFTLVWDYNLKEDEDYVDEIIAVFSEVGAQICIVELSADQKVRLVRNVQEDRLEAKPSKRNIEWSEKSLLNFDKEYRMVSKENEFPDKPIFKIDNTNMPAVVVADIIKSEFDL